MNGTKAARATPAAFAMVFLASLLLMTRNPPNGAPSSVFAGGAGTQDHTGAEHADMGQACVEVRPGEKRPEFGCFIVAASKNLHFDQPTVFWHLRTFPARVAADAARSATGIVAEEDGRVWLSEFGPRELVLHGGEPVAIIGPLELSAAKTHTAELAFAVLRPGDRSRVHIHPGPEAWYVLAGEQCLETPAGARKAKAGESMFAPPNVSMELRITGTAIRKSLTLIIHDSAQAWGLPSDWKPTGACTL